MVRTYGRKAFLGFLGLAALSLSACTDSSLHDLREAQFTGSAFDQALAIEYRLLSEDEAAGYNWPDSNLFAEKGLKAAYGQPVQPEQPTQHGLSGAEMLPLVEARTELLSLSDEEHRNNQPKQLAKAWSQYECWVTKAAKNPNADDTLTCHENFDNAITALTPLAETQPDASENAAPAEVPAFGEPAENPAPAEAVAKKQQALYVLLFRLDSSELNVTGIAKLREIAQGLHEKDGWTIMLNGHTDRSGSDEYNMALSGRRADAVKAALVKLGVDGTHIQTFAFGETDPAVPTEDGVKEPANRRVEILLN